MWTGDQYLNNLYEKAEEQRGRESEQLSAAQRKQNLTRSLAESLGQFDRVRKQTPVLMEEKLFEGYTRTRVELSVIDGVSFGAYVLKPTSATNTASSKFPGVIAVHGHGYGSRQICGMLEDGSEDTGKPDIYNHFAIQLVRKGFIVIAPDVIGFGERRMLADLANDPNSPSSCYTMSTHLLMLGKTLTGMRVAEMQGVLDYFAEREDVDAERMGIVGFSGGSLISYVLAALDERIRATVLIGFPNTFKDSIMAVHHCVCNYVPGMLLQAELPELIGLIAPRPVFLESGDADPIFPVKGFHNAVEQLQHIYKESDSPDSLAYDLFPGAHEVSGRNSFDWLVRQLSNL